MWFDENNQSTASVEMIWLSSVKLNLASPMHAKIIKLNLYITRDIHKHGIIS